MEPPASIRSLEPEDWVVVSRIYAEGIATGHATFETTCPTWEEWDGTRLHWGRLVAIVDGGVVGFVAASRTSPRPCYAGVVEHSVYVGKSARGAGIGRMLLESFVAAARHAGAWTIQTSVFPENAASVSLHERCGFRLVGRRERIGRRGGAWRDTLLYELRL